MNKIMEMNQSPRSLQEMYGRSGFLNEAQREKFCNRAMDILGAPETTLTEDIKICLQEVWNHYDTGGISYGRSARSLLIESALGYIESNEMEKAKACVSMLLSMYHDMDYINNVGRWMDFKVETPLDAGMRQLFLLTIAGLILDIDELPSMEHISHNDILRVSGKYS